MTLDAADVGEITRIAQQVAAEAIRNLARGTGGANLPVPVVRLATVGSTADSGAETSIRNDGDANAVPAVNATGTPLEPGDRVLVSYLPPLGVYITSCISRGVRDNWTPALFGPSATNNPSAASGHFTRHGHTVTIYGSWTWAAGSGFGTAPTLAGLPYPAISDGDGVPQQLHVYYYDSSVPQRYSGLAVIGEGNSAATLYCSSVFAAPGNIFLPAVSNTAPMTWAAGDQIIVSGTYDTDA